MHLEDTGKSLHVGGATGQHPRRDALTGRLQPGRHPLHVEIVTRREIRSPEVARAYVMELRELIVALGVSDARMEQGSLRCDANISLRRHGESDLAMACSIIILFSWPSFQVKLNDQPLPNEEIAVLLKPNETAVFEYYLPHNPISKERALRLSSQSFNERLNECRDFWQEKLDHAARIKLPEKRIEEMIQAGLLHLDLITYGIDPENTLAPSIGVYSPIGTESSPIIQFFNSMGLHETARRSLMYFLDKQHEDGMIQNFGGYMVETGAALWSIGEYFRYTHDTAWVKDVKLKLLKSCDFLLQWRQRNKKSDLMWKGLWYD